jgi:hypothetical protein
MKIKHTVLLLITALLTGTCLFGTTSEVQASEKTLGFFFNRMPFTDTFYFDECGGFSSTGSNRYFIIEPGFKIVMVGKQGQHTVKDVLTVLDQTKTIDGIETRIVEDQETLDDALTEISRNYFAICNKTNSVFYFGEDVDTYENGVIVGHDGAWQSGQNGARAGLQMPGIILLGARYFMEVAPGVAQDRSEILSMTETVTTPAGTFNNCLKIKETSAVEPGSYYKYYAPGIGLIKDGSSELTDYTRQASQQ